MANKSSNFSRHETANKFLYNLEGNMAKKILGYLSLATIPQQTRCAADKYQQKFSAYPGPKYYEDHSRSGAAFGASPG
jgi:hypothetical protein